MKLSYRNERNARCISAYYNKPLVKADWFNVKAISDDEAEILVFDYIGWPYNDAGDFIRALSGITAKDVVIRINSPGGDVFDANAIYNAIRNHQSKPTTRIESLSASAASYVGVAGYKKQAYKNTMIMVHEPMTGMWGNQHEFRETADILSQISENMVDMYVDNTSVGKKEIRDMLKVETWMNAKKAKEKGFIDTIIEAGKPVKANFDLSVFANIPDEFKIENQSEEQKPEPDIRSIEKLLRDAGGLSKNKAKALLARGWQADGETETKNQETETNDESIQCDAGILARLTKNIELLKGK